MDNNKFSLYRRIRHDRTYRPLGKMSWWRVALGSLLLLSILFFTGIVSRPFAARDEFRTAKALLLFPAWMERYHPEDLAYLEAGLLFQNGEYEEALEGFDALEGEAALTMRSRAALRLAEERLEAGDTAGAQEAAAEIDEALLPETEAEALASLRAALAGA